MTRAERWVERGVAAALLVAAAVPFWAGRFLPFLDLPQHLGLAAVIAHHADGNGAAFARYYTVEPMVTPYWTYYALTSALARIFTVETASRLVFTAYALAVPVGAAYLLASFGRDRRLAVLSVPLVFSTNLFFGFATFLVSVPVFLFALGATERHLGKARPERWRAIGVAVLAALVFLSHAQTYLLLGACVLVLLAMHVRSARALAAAVAPFVPSLVLFGIWFGRNFLDAQHARAEVHTPRWRAYGTLGNLGAVYERWDVVVRTMPERLFGAFTDRSDMRVGAVLLAVFVLMLVVDRWGGRRDVVPGGVLGVGDTGTTPPRFAYRGEVVLLVLLAAYLVAPASISGQWYLNARYLLFAALAAPLLLRSRLRGLTAWLAAGAAVVAVAACVSTAVKVRTFQRQVGDFEQVARALPPGGRVLGLPFDLGAGGPVRLWPFLHWACWQQVLAGGDVGFSFAGLPSIPVRYRSGMQAPHPYEWRPHDFDWSSMGSWYDAFLVSGTPRGRGGAELERHAEPVVRAGTWSLWRRRNGLTDRSPSSR